MRIFQSRQTPKEPLKTILYKTILLSRHSVLLWKWLEALTKGVISIGYNYKSTWIEVLDTLLHGAHLLTVYNKEDHLLLGARVHTACFDVCATSLDVVDNQAAQLVAMFAVGVDEKQHGTTLSRLFKTKTNR